MLPPRRKFAVSSAVDVMRLTAIIGAPVLLPLLFAPLLGQNVAAPAKWSQNAQQLSEPPIPADPLEPVTVARPVQDVNQRAEIINLLTSAFRQSNVRAYAYDLKTRFTAFGSSGSDGSWQLHDTSPAHNIYRWTAQGPSYSVVNLYYNKVLYSNQPASTLPLRLAQVRGAMFYVRPALGPRASLRTAREALNGGEVVCTLISHPFKPNNASGGRQWEETEYCVDPKSSNLITYSPVPGLYIAYDYSKALHFHDKVIPNSFTITQAGHTVIEAQTESVGDASEDLSAFQPAGLNALGVGSIMTFPFRYRVRVPSRAAGASAIQIVIVHAMQTPEGRLQEAELIASADPVLNAAALDEASKWREGKTMEDIEPGTTPQSHEVFLTLEYGAAP
jgi:hypothetical protein